MKAEIVSVGTELILGDIVDTNAAFLAKELAKLGIDVYYKSTVGDNKLRLQETIKIATDRSDIIILTGGLGPTEDDLTKQALCDYLNISLYQDESEILRLKNFFQVRGKAMSSNNLRQALIPRDAVILENAIGTASGLIVKNSAKYYILLPGPPSEMQHIFSNKVIPWLKSNLVIDNTLILSHTLKFIGISESRLETELNDIFQKQTNPTLALLAKNGEIHIRITGKVKNHRDFEKLVSPLKKEILNRVGKYFYGTDELKIEEIIGGQLIKHNLTLAIAESCTGGLIAKRLTDISGSSKYFLGSVVAYDNSVKNKLLKVSEKVLNEYGAVSEQTARAMAIGVKELLLTDLAIAITGISGPSGGTDLKPVGLVYISVIGQNIDVCKKFVFSGNRQDIRWRSSSWALNLLLRSLNTVG